MPEPSFVPVLSSRIGEPELPPVVSTRYATLSGVDVATHGPSCVFCTWLAVGLPETPLPVP